MKRYVIGIIDDDKYEIIDIERSILINLPKNINENDVDFLEYSLKEVTNTLVNTLVEEVIEDARKQNVNILLIDYRLVVNRQNIDGSEIFHGINKVIPKFPVIMLTNVSDGCYSKDYIDADKVYDKHLFFKVEEQYSKEKIKHLFLNLEKYNRVRAELSVNLSHEIENLAKESYNDRSLQSIVEIEKQLDDFFPVGQTTIEKILDVSELKEAVALIEKAKGLLEDKDED